MTTLIGVISFLLLNFKKILSFNELNASNTVLLIIFVSLLIITGALIYNTFYYFLKIYSLAGYKRLDLLSVDYDTYKYNLENVTVLFIDEYQEAHRINSRINDEKSINYTHGLKFFISSIAALWFVFLFYLFL